MVLHLSSDVADLKTKVTVNEASITYHDESLNDIQSNVHSLHDTNLQIRQELNKLNLVLFGLPELPDESPESLLNSVIETIKPLSEKNIPIDVAYRIGKKIANSSSRPVKIRFLTLSDRDCVLKRKLSLPDGISVKEDLPFEVRKAHAILLKKKSEAIASGVPDEEISINFSSKKIKIRDEIFDARDDLHQSQPFLVGNQRKRPRPVSLQSILPT